MNEKMRLQCTKRNNTEEIVVVCWWLVWLVVCVMTMAPREVVCVRAEMDEGLPCGVTAWRAVAAGAGGRRTAAQASTRRGERCVQSRFGRRAG